MPRQAGDKFVSLPNGVNLHYYEWVGDGPVVIMLHPSHGYGMIWEWVIENLDDKFHIFAPEMRAHGQSDRPDGDYSAQEYAEDLKLFMEELKIDRAVIVGHSLGGRVAQVFSAEYPSKVMAMAQVSGPHVSNFYPTRDVALHLIRGIAETAQRSEAFDTEDELFEFLQATPPWKNEPDEAIRHRIAHSYVRGEDGKLAPRCDNVRVAQGLTHLLFNLRPFAGKVECPVLLLRASKGGTSREQAEELARFWKDARVADVEGYYTLELENPASVAKALTEFTKELEIG